MKMYKFGLTETKLFHFYSINWGRGGGSSESTEPPLDPQLNNHNL